MLPLGYNQANFSRPVPLLNSMVHLNNLRSAFNTCTDAAAIHPDNLDVAEKLHMKINDNDKGDGDGKKRFWSNIKLHHQQWVQDGKILNPNSFASFWDSIRGMTPVGVMCWETYDEVLDGGDEASWIGLHKTHWDTAAQHVEIMETKGVGYWLQYYKKNVVKGRNADDVILGKPKTRKRKREPLGYIGIPPFSMLPEALVHNNKRPKPNDHSDAMYHRYDINKNEMYGDNNNKIYGGSNNNTMYGVDDNNKIYGIDNNNSKMYVNENINNTMYDNDNKNKIYSMDNKMYVNEEINRIYGMDNDKMYTNGMYGDDNDNNNNNTMYGNDNNNKKHVNNNKKRININNKTTKQRPQLLSSKKQKINKNKVANPLGDLQNTLNKLKKKKITLSEVPRRHKVCIGVPMIYICNEENNFGLAMKKKVVVVLLDSMFQTDEADQYQLGQSHMLGLIKK
eukprot:467902_1